MRVAAALDGETEIEDRLMAQALYNSFKEIRGVGRPEGEGQSNGVTNKLNKTGGTQESVNKD